MKPKKNSNSFLTSNQAAHFLNISLSTLKKFIYSGKIKTLKTPGGHHRISKDDLFKMIKGDQRPAPAGIFKDQTSLGICQGLVHLLEKKYSFSRGHSASVADTSLKVARKLDFSFERLGKLYLASLLHDVGMLAIDRNILNKAAGLSEQEYSIIKTHPVFGEELASANSEFSPVSGIIKQHHERYDGAGYPEGLKGDQICLEAKIIALAESFAYMTTNNSYRLPRPKQEAVSEIDRNTAKQFDPQIVKAFMAIYKSKE